MKKNRWSPPGWPWELELLALIFVIIAIGVPWYLEHARPPELQTQQQISLIAKAQMENQSQVATWQQLQGFFWALAVIGIYVAHLIIAGASSDYISTPFTYLFSPLTFAMITYYRLFQISRASSTETRIISGSPMEIAGWIAGVLIITFLVARIRMARHMLNFRSLDWEISSPVKFDNTYFELIAHFQPLVYPPRMYRACKEGILIEGWFYAMPLSFDHIQGVDAAHGSSVTSSGYYLATSSKSLMRIRVVDKTVPILISPRDFAPFLHYCEHQVAARNPGSSTHTSDTKGGSTATRTKA
ncbi:MAG: hypothetical protein A2X46_11820 [Lentisphaerae bacterium GWF2_57_35]|nr:MAG: hypothetical protein A2X46_11820 [Lentisphaerae bacterium GWF2_57_35]